MWRKSRGRARCHLAQRTRQLHPRGTAADDDERHPGAATRLVLLALGLLEGEENAAAHLERVLDALHPGGVLGPVGVAEVVVLRSGRDDQMVAIESPSANCTVRPARSMAETSARTTSVLRARRRTARIGAATSLGSSARRRHLVDQRLKEVMVAAVDDCHPDVIAPAKELGRLETGETGPDNHHVGRRSGSIAVPDVRTRGPEVNAFGFRWY